MTNSTIPMKGHQTQSNEVITPEMRKEVVRIKEQLGEYAGYLQDLFYNLNTIGDAVFRAQQAADCCLPTTFSALGTKHERENWKKRRILKS